MCVLTNSLSQLRAAMKLSLNLVIFHKLHHERKKSFRHDCADLYDHSSDYVNIAV